MAMPYDHVEVVCKLFMHRPVHSSCSNTYIIIIPNSVDDDLSETVIHDCWSGSAVIIVM